MMAVGVANPMAQGQATTKEEMEKVKAITKSDKLGGKYSLEMISNFNKVNQRTKTNREMEMTIKAKTPAI
jgi:hypothetical protein